MNNKEGVGEEKTYEQIADEIGLAPINKQRFVYYMKARWSKEENLQCSTGYA
jgi:hypothetical protein